MLYCDYDAYQAAGGAMTAERYAVFGGRASRLIDRITLGRAAGALEAHPDELKQPLADACAQIADVLEKSAGAVCAQASGLASASTDGYSEAYTSSGEAARRAASLAYGILSAALGADPYNLLYAGVL